MRRPKLLGEIEFRSGSAAANAADHDRAVRLYNAFFDHAAGRRDIDAPRRNNHRANGGSANLTGCHDNAAALFDIA